MARGLLLVTASRALAERPESEAWARAEYDAVLDQMEPGDVLLTGKAVADVWAAIAAALRGIKTIQLHTDGWRYENGAPVSRWATDGELRAWGPKQTPLERNLRLAQCARKAADAGWSVGVLALKAAWSATNGTGHTARACEALGLPVRREDAPDNPQASAVLQPVMHAMRTGSPAAMIASMSRPVPDERKHVVPEFTGMQRARASLAAKGIELPLSDYEKLDRGIEIPAAPTRIERAPVRDIVWIDLETTGLYAKKGHQLIEIGMLRTGQDGAEIRDRFHARVRLMPGTVIDEYALSINKLEPRTPEWHAGAMDMEEMLVELEKRLPENYYVGGHNCQFDFGFLVASWARVGRPCPIEGRTQICTKKIAGPLVRRRVLANAKLATVCDHFGVSNEGAHDAMRDIERTVAVYRHLRGGMAGAEVSP